MSETTTPTTTAQRKALHAAASVAAAAVLAGLAWYGYDRVARQPVTHVTFAGSTERIPPESLDLLARAIQEAPPPLALATVRDAARRLPWVREAAVRRRFPDAVEVTLEVHEPLARWNDASLVSKRGEVFAVRYEEPLPRFRGQDAAAPLMARQYPAMVSALAALDSPIAELRLSARGAWQVKLASGLELELGRGDVETRMARFVAAWPQLAARGIAPQHADLRYPNGFAVRKALSPALSQGRGRS